MTSDIGIFVINLKRREDRLRVISSYLEEAVVVEAIDGYGSLSEPTRELPQKLCPRA